VRLARRKQRAIVLVLLWMSGWLALFFWYVRRSLRSEDGAWFSLAAVVPAVVQLVLIGSFVGVAREDPQPKDSTNWGANTVVAALAPGLACPN
jgi:hypothetical protein